MSAGDSPRRRTNLTYEPCVCDQVVAFMARGYSLTAFAGEIGVSRATLIKWSEGHSPFAAAIAQGQAARTLYLETEMLAAASAAKVSAHVLALKNAAPDDWRERPEKPLAEISAAHPAAITVTLPGNGRE